MLTIRGSANPDGKSTASSVYTRGEPCDTVPNEAIGGAYQPVTLEHNQHVITWSAEVTADLTTFEHSDGVMYVRSNGCVVYQYAQDTTSQPFLGTSLATPIVMSNGDAQTSVCAPPPPSPPRPPTSPSPLSPCACSDACAGLRDDGGVWTRNGVLNDDDGSGRILQTADFGYCDTTVDGSCLPASYPGSSGAVSFANNGVCEDGGSSSEHEEDYYMCEFRGGDLDTPYCTNTRNSGGVVNNGLNAWWLPCALGTDCTDCGSRCGQQATPAQARISLDAPQKIAFNPSTLTLKPGQTATITVYIDTTPAATPPSSPALSVTISASHPQVVVSPSSLSWSGSDSPPSGRVFTLSVPDVVVNSASNTISVSVLTNTAHYAGFTPSFVVDVQASAPSAPPIAPLNGCGQLDAYTNPVTEARCQEYFTAYGSALHGGTYTAHTEYADTAAGICYYERETHNVVFASLSSASVCEFTEYECFCHGTPPPPPPPGACGTDYCNCPLTGAEAGGYAICPGNTGCDAHPSRCLSTWNSVCTNNVCGPARYARLCAARSTNVWCLSETGLQEDGGTDCVSECAAGQPPPSPATPPGAPAPPRSPIGSGR